LKTPDGAQSPSPVARKFLTWEGDFCKIQIGIFREGKLFDGLNEKCDGGSIRRGLRKYKMRPVYAVSVLLVLIVPNALAATLPNITVTGVPLYFERPIICRVIIPLQCFKFVFTEYR